MVKVCLFHIKNLIHYFRCMTALFYFFSNSMFIPLLSPSFRLSLVLLFSIPKAQTSAPRGTHTCCGTIYRLSIPMPGTQDLAMSSSDWLNIYAWGPVTEVTTGTPVGPLTPWPKGLSGMLQASLLESFLELFEWLLHSHISREQTLRQVEI